MSSAENYTVRLSDNKNYCFYPWTFEDARSLTKTIKVFKVRTIRDCQDEDWKTAIAQNKKRIPKGTELEVKQVLRNFYGVYIDVEYNGSRYYLDPIDLEYVGSYEIKEQIE